MTERPILFTGPMVRAILDGAKTQTRRILTQRNSTVLGQTTKALWAKLDWSKPARVDRGPHGMHGEASSYLHVQTTEDTVYRVRCRYSIGDRLWVKETFYAAGLSYFYRADWEDEEGEPDWTWKPSIFMRRVESRLTLEITDIRVQQVQEISEEDAEAEGTPIRCRYAGRCNSGRCAAQHYREGFHQVWNSINGQRPGGAWEDHPWVWAITFRRVE